jgi:signal transduction histidine kinase/DNA-binding response OmpR family regulator
MQAANTQSGEPSAIFDEFVHETLILLYSATLALMWVWTGAVALFNAERAGVAYSALALTAVTGLLLHQIAARHLRLAVASYLLCLLVVASLVVLTYRSPGQLLLYLPVILIASALTDQRGLWVTTGLAVLTALAVGVQIQAPAGDLMMALFMLLITAVTAWLSTRRLYTALGWALNMTERAHHNAEEARAHRSELKRVLQSLDIALSRLERSHRALAFAQETAEKAYRFKAEFVANVSHELRTPLNLIVGFSEMMTTAPESYGGFPLPREYRGDMLAIYRSSRHLLDLINDVLDLSQIESGRMALHKERVRLSDVVAEAMDIVRGLAEARKLQFLIEVDDEEIAIDLDRIRIRQVLLNLFTNAMRYTENGWVRVRTLSAEHEAIIEVADSGRGIAPEKLARAFEAFDRMDEEQLTQGSGLGLAVSKKFVEMHDGRMWVESEVGKGTVVSFALPLPVRDQRLPLSQLNMSRPLHEPVWRPQILVLHTDPRALVLLRRHVGGCDFILADSIDAADSMLQRVAPDAVLIDVEAQSWWEAIAERLPEATRLPTLVCPLPNMHHFGVLLGATDFLPKPVLREDLALVLQRLPSPPHVALVVDDDPHVVRLIGRMLRSVAPELRVLECFGGAEGLELARAHHPDVIFVDLMMPGISGKQFIEVAAAEGALAHIPIIVVSVRSVDQETAPVQGDLHVRRASGFALGELLSLIDSLLNHLTRSDAMALANGATDPAAPAGLRV